MSALYAVLAFVAAERTAELFLSARNTRRLLARGGIESAREQYPFFVVLHAAWWTAMAITIPPHRSPNAALLALFFALQIARFAVIATLGPYWTTRIVTVPGEPLVRSGPYRFFRHPNYVIVAAEIALLPLAFGAWVIAVVFSVCNAALLTWRIRAEERALAPRRSG
jgi:methyltransferase